MSDIDKRGYVNPKALVSTEWVANHLHDPKIRIVESNEDPLLYPSGHIPGAVQIDWTTDLNHPVVRDYLNRKGCQKTVSATIRQLFFMEIKITGGPVMLYGYFSFLVTQM